MNLHHALISVLIIGCGHLVKSQVVINPQYRTLAEGVSNNAVCGKVDDLGNHVIFSFAGIDSTLQYSGIHLKNWSYNIDNDSISSLPSLPDTLGKIAPAASVIGDTIYIVGGYHVDSSGAEVSSNRIHRFNIRSKQFEPDGSPIPVAIDDHVQGVWREQLIYVVTGWSNTGNTRLVQIYNPKLDTWTQGTSMPLTNQYRSFGAAGVILGDTIYYYGGASSGLGFPIQNYLRKGGIDPQDPTHITWHIDTLPQLDAIYRGAAIAFGSSVYFVGGSRDTYNFNGLTYSDNTPTTPSNSIYRYESFSGKFYEVNNTIALPMDLRQVADCSGVGYIWGGLNHQLNPFKQITQLTLLPNNLEDESAKLQTLAYPTPFSNRINLAEYFEWFGVFNAQGELMAQGTGKGPILTETLPNGLYILKAMRSGKWVSQRMVK